MNVRIAQLDVKKEVAENLNNIVSILDGAYPDD